MLGLSRSWMIERRTDGFKAELGVAATVGCALDNKSRKADRCRQRGQTAGVVSGGWRDWGSMLGSVARGVRNCG